MTDSLKTSCAVCARKLSRLTRPGAEPEWIHTGRDEDHLPVPVQEDEVETIYSCDFCYQDDAWFLLPVRSFATQTLVEGFSGEMTFGGNRSDGDWSVCWPCAALVASNEWRRLFLRVLGTYSEIHGVALSSDARAPLWEYFRAVQAHITGPIRER